MDTTERTRRQRIVNRLAEIASDDDLTTHQVCSAVVTTLQQEGATRLDFWELDNHPGRWFADDGSAWHWALRRTRNTDRRLFDVLVPDRGREGR